MQCSRRWVVFLTSLALFASCTLSAAPAIAQTISWNAAVQNGSWNVAANWIPQTVPVSGVSAALLQSDGATRIVQFVWAGTTNLNTVTVDATGAGRIVLAQAQDTLNASTLTLGASGAGVYQLSGGVLNARALGVGAHGAATFTHSGGVNQSDGYLSIGDGSTGVGTYLLQSTAVVNVPQIYAGYDGTGTMSVSGGQVVGGENSFFVAGANFGANGTLAVSAGVVSTHSHYIGENGNGTLKQTGGSVTALGFVSLANSAMGRGTYTLSAGTLNTNELDVGYRGTGTFVQSGGVANISGTLALAVNQGAKGNFTVTGGTFAASSTTVNAGGTLQFTGGSVSLGSLSVNGGKVSVSAGAGRTLLTTSVDVGNGGTVDLVDNDLLVRGGSTYTQISTSIASARAGGAWTGSGITSSAARTAVAADRTLAVVTGAQYHFAAGAGATFNGLTVAPTDVLVKFSYYGDTDLNGKVDGADYARIDTGFQTLAVDWFNGDFDYNNKVDGADYAAIDAAFNSQSGTLREALKLIEASSLASGPQAESVLLVQQHLEQFGDGYATAFLSHVPEPSTLLLLVALLALAARRRSGFFVARPAFVR